MTKIRFALLAALAFSLALSCSSDSPSFEKLSTLPLSAGRISDVWGYVGDDGTEYAIVGFGLFLPASSQESGVYIIDVSDARNPVIVRTMRDVAGFDVKVWQNYLYTVNGNGQGEGSIIDLTDPENAVAVGTFPSSHNITISDQGYLYAESPGLKIYNLNPDPLNPSLVWEGGEEGHDATVVGNRLYDFHGGTATRIYDITDPASPRLLGELRAPNIAYNHSGWPSEDGNFLFICDELSSSSGSDITSWDISDPTNPELAADFRDGEAHVHNIVVIDGFAYVSYYSAGFRIFDVSDPKQFKLVEEFDTAPGTTGENFGGAFGVYPFTPSGNIYISDGETGLNIFSFNKLQPTNSGNVLAP